ncbi:MAG: PAS domain-containing protein [Actinomycetota bacterium]
MYVEAVDATDPTISRVVFVSPQVQEVLGYSSDELVSEPNHLQRLIHPDDWPGFAEEDRRSSRTGSPFSHEYRAIAKDGSIVWLQSRATLIRDDEGRPRFWHGIAIDITPRLQREQGGGALGGSIPGGSDRKTVAPPTRD